MNPSIRTILLLLVSMLFSAVISPQFQEFVQALFNTQIPHRLVVYTGMLPFLFVNGALVSLWIDYREWRAKGARRST
ncbi:MAG: hypothetical protein KGZ64_09195 [Thermaerobacter sp.]|nr:hypothetical protein [Thermaerobacter sp.]